MAVPAMLDRTMEKMLDVLCALGRVGSPPQFGDDDGGRVFDPRRNRAGHLVDALATGAVLFNRADFKAVAGGIREETIWLLGAAGARRFEELSPRQPAATSFPLEHSGIYVMSSSDPLTRQLVIDAVPHRAGRGSHRHADALTLTLAFTAPPLLFHPPPFAHVHPHRPHNRLPPPA